MKFPHRSSANWNVHFLLNTTAQSLRSLLFQNIHTSKDIYISVSLSNWTTYHAKKGNM